MDLSYSPYKFLYIAVFFLLLGVGNIVFGTIRQSEYQVLLEQAGAHGQPQGKDGFNTTSTKRLASSPLFSGVNLDKRAQHLHKIQSRIQFYQFVAIGGRWFLGLAGVLFLLFVFFLARNVGHEERKK